MRPRGITKDQEPAIKSLDNNSIHKKRYEIWEKPNGPQ